MTKPAKIGYRYWDSNCFLDYLKQTEDRYDQCYAVIKSCEKGETIIVTSALTLTEVLYIKGRPADKLDRSMQGKIINAFNNKYVEVFDVSQMIADAARDAVWDYPPLQPKDAIHVATAIAFCKLTGHKLDQLDTFDKDLLKLDGLLSLPYGTRMKIGEPNLPVQLELPTHDND